MTRDEFITEYYKVSARSIQLSEKARREGLLSLEEEIDDEESTGRAISRMGLRLAVDGTDRDIIDKILSNIIKQEEDKYTRLLMEIRKETILSLSDGLNPYYIALVLNSFTDISHTDDPIMQKFREEADDKGTFTEEEINTLIGGRF